MVRISEGKNNGIIFRIGCIFYIYEQTVNLFRGNLVKNVYFDFCDTCTVPKIPVNDKDLHSHESIEFRYIDCSYYKRDVCRDFLFKYSYHFRSVSYHWSLWFLAFRDKIGCPPPNYLPTVCWGKHCPVSNHWKLERFVLHDPNT